ncbi:MAG: bifunctional diaminohydroxyphosphoribosylaminopyrimidine deaminase/5-amino-6-(5-phosphoribosylamino)uracil reductase RibD [Myxococcales bacterium]
MDRDDRFMRTALVEAEKGRGRTHPNPVVGAVLVRNGRAIAAGHHAQAGGPHAEIAALRAAGARARGAAIFVTLEPCNHFGRTPPCTDALIAAGVARVVYGSTDPNPSVRGHGARRLRAAGVEVVAGVLRDDCDASNEQWFNYITRGLPWVHLKAAVTLDGKLATAAGDSRWVSGAASRQHVHHLRDSLDAVLVGIGTALADDPRLTVRLPRQGRAAGAAGTGVPPRDPLRVVVDSSARLPPTALMLRQRSRAATLVAVTARAPRSRRAALERAGAAVLPCRADGAGRVDLRDLLRRLARTGVTSVLVEGGAGLLGSFLQRDLWDELSLFLAPRVAGAGGLSWAGFPGSRAMRAALPVGPLRVRPVGEDLLVSARRPR